jgi:DNA-binding transcriptional ArsR family regulator
LVPARHIPGFLAPPPATPVPDLELESRALRATAAQTVRDDLAHLEPSPRVDALRQDPEAQLALLAEAISEFFATALAPDLARRTGMSAGGVSQHLTALRDAGLGTAHRTGRHVLYVRSRIGEALIEGDAAPRSW